MPPKGIKRAALEAAGPKVKRNKHDYGSLPNHYTVDNWKGFLLKKILEAALAVKVSGYPGSGDRTAASIGSYEKWRFRFEERREGVAVAR